jgi:hypothetical protein
MVAGCASSCSKDELAALRNSPTEVELGRIAGSCIDENGEVICHRCPEPPEDCKKMEAEMEKGGCAEKCSAKQIKAVVAEIEDLKDCEIKDSSTVLPAFIMFMFSLH